MTTRAVTVADVLALLEVQPLSRRELARELGVPWQHSGLHAALMELLRTDVIDLVGDGYPERWAVKERKG